MIFTSTSSPGAGGWRGIELNSSASSIDHAEIRYTGAAFHAGVEITGASPSITSSEIHHGYQGILWSAGGSPQIAGNEIHDNQTDGVYAALSVVDSGAVDIHDNDVHDNSASGITVSGGGSSIAGTSLGGNDIDSNGGEAMRFSGVDIPTDIGDNTLTSNHFNALFLSGTFTASTTLADHAWGYNPGNLTVASGATLSIAAGADFYNSGKWTIRGDLEIDGTSSDQVTLGGSWLGLDFKLGSGGSIDNADISGAQGDQAIYAIGSPPSVTNSQIHDNLHSGLIFDGDSGHQRQHRRPRQRDHRQWRLGRDRAERRIAPRGHQHGRQHDRGQREPDQLPGW